MDGDTRSQMLWGGASGSFRTPDSWGTLTLSADPAAERLAITDHTATDVGASIAFIEWRLSDPADGFVEYGPTPAYGSRTRGEVWLLRVPSAAGPEPRARHGLLLPDQLERRGRRARVGDRHLQHQSARLSRRRPPTPTLPRKGRGRARRARYGERCVGRDRRTRKGVREDGAGPCPLRAARAGGGLPACRR